MRKFSKIILFISYLFFIWSCQKEEFISSKNAKLSFSNDTVLFDTVFTSVGSVTQYFTVKNPHDETIKIKSISLANGESSNFRLNINGNLINKLSDVEIYGNDSIYIFVEVTLNPNDKKEPFVHQDSVVFLTNGNLQDVDLVAWGQNVHLINGENESGIIKTETWTNDKPYLVYNSMLVDSLETLTIEEGTKIYFHKSSSMIVAGNIKVNGTLEEPVIFQGDRLEEMYEDLPGQWGTVVFLEGSNNNEINFAEIKNAEVGLQIGTLNGIANGLTNPTVLIKNTKISSMSYSGISALGSYIYAYNCLITNCGFYGVSLIIGGNYEFNHCTIANYWSFSNRTEPAVAMSNYYNYSSENQEDIYFSGNLEKAIFGNCIIYGDKNGEIGFARDENLDFNYKFINSIMKISYFPDDTTDLNYFENCFFNKNPKFISIYDDENYELDTLSFAKDKGKLEISNNFPLDLNGNNRIEDEQSDLGAFERIEKK